MRRLGVIYHFIMALAVIALGSCEKTELLKFDRPSGISGSVTDGRGTAKNDSDSANTVRLDVIAVSYLEDEGNHYKKSAIYVKFSNLKSIADGFTVKLVDTMPVVEITKSSSGSPIQEGDLLSIRTWSPGGGVDYVVKLESGDVNLYAMSTDEISPEQMKKIEKETGKEYSPPSFQLEKTIHLNTTNKVQLRDVVQYG